MRITPMVFKGNLHSYTHKKSYDVKLQEIHVQSNFFGEHGNNNLVFQEIKLNMSIAILDFMTSFG